MNKYYFTMGNEQKKINKFNQGLDSLNEIKDKKDKKENKKLTYNLISFISELCNSSLIDDNNLKLENNISCLFNPYMDIRNADKLIGKKEESYLVENNLNYSSWFQYYNKIENFEKIKSNIPFGLVENKINQFMKIVNEDKFDYHKGFKNVFYNLKKSKSEDRIIKKKKDIKNEVKQNEKNNSKQHLLKLNNERTNLKGNEIKKTINSSQTIINQNLKIINKSNDKNKRINRKKNTFNHENTLKLNDNTIKSYYSRNPTLDDFKSSKNSISSIIDKNYSISSQNSFTNIFQPKIYQPSNVERSQFFVQEEENSYAEIARKKIEMNKKKNLKKNLNNNHLYYTNTQREIKRNNPFQDKHNKNLNKKNQTLNHQNSCNNENNLSNKIKSFSNKSNNNSANKKEKKKETLKNSKSNDNLLKKKTIDTFDIEKDIYNVNSISKKLSIINENIDEVKVSNAKIMKENKLNNINPFQN